VLREKQKFQDDFFELQKETNQILDNFSQLQEEKNRLQNELDSLEEIKGSLVALRADHTRSKKLAADMELE